ncbi:amidohydrolase family protein [Puniceibacterium sp. IMCC21224]|uniref:amidohydrolase family protein n=1 Tax=Puniceibacterium sp. IMCC21224 TaxID=1618204 RepID=UPI00064D7458|nr:amidohydrolase family protein [Puniceibacterium sp. IMCC21224]KMK65028.1 4-oxalomesaconate hydratase [Puniceibacterium sp. IMCC21224]
MIIDCHGHYTTEPAAFMGFRKAQIAHFDDPTGTAAPVLGAISDDEIRESIVNNQLKALKDRGADMTIFSPRASGMGHHIGDEAVSLEWTRLCNDMIHRVTQLFPENFIGVCQLPQSPDAPIENSIAELERCVNDLGVVGCNLNPDPSGGMWTGRPLTDKTWYPFFEKMVELDVPAMIHVSGSCNQNFHATGAHYMNADTTAFMQLLQGDLFTDFPELRLIIPHGGGAVPYHWGRYRGLADMLGKPHLREHVMKNVYFDTCVYHQPGIDCLFKVIDVDNILFASEMFGAVKGVDPETGHNFDDTKRYVDALDIPAADKAKVFEGNARRVYPRLDTALKARGL